VGSHSHPCHWAGTVQTWNKQSFFLTFLFIYPPSKLCFKQVKFQAALLKAVELLICSEVLKSFAFTNFSTVTGCGRTELLPTLQKASFVQDSTQTHAELYEAIATASFCPASPFCLCFQHSCNQLPDLQAEGRPWGQSRTVLDSNLFF